MRCWFFSRSSRSLRVFIATVIVAAQNPAILSGEVVDLLSYDSAYRITSSSINDNFGFAMDSCDFNGDGRDDLVVTAPSADGPSGTRPGTGEAFVYLGRLGAWSGEFPLATSAATRIIGVDQSDHFGESVACGDVNGDGFDDILLGAKSADSKDNARINAGEIQFVFGSAAPPPLIDLSLSSAAVIYGTELNAYLGDIGQLAAGDINGDGFADVVCTQDEGKRPSDGLAVGKVFVLFGRAVWPPSIDLLNGADLVIYGENYLSLLGSHFRVLDLGGATTALDLVLGAQLGDGPGVTRSDAGDIFVLRGRPTWPSVIDLSTSAADMRFFGADVSDRLGAPQSLASGDLDADGTAEIWLSTVVGDGVSNTLTSAGEIRLSEILPGRPVDRDMQTWSDFSLFGGKLGDQLGFAVRTGDVNGDGRSDLVTAVSYADGPGDVRLQAGETLVFYGPRSFPATLEEPAAEEDLIVYGAEPSDELRNKAVLDLNHDGFDDLAASVRAVNIVRVSELVVISHLDSDGDGVLQLADNCPLVANPSQQDFDLDRVGDACDGDYDADGLPDATDCRMNRASAGQPAEVQGVVVGASIKDRMTWTAAQFADSYDVVRGEIGRLPQGDYGSCMNATDTNPSDTEFVDASIPLPSSAWFYMVRARDLECPAVGSWGRTSSEFERLNTNPAQCP
jgi:hypothetical protein